MPFIFRLMPTAVAFKGILSARLRAWRAKLNTTEQVFTEIYKNNTWGGSDSVSGTGSDDRQTQIITSELKNVFDKYAISSMLDIPCGDFHWIKNVDLQQIDYIGADIVDDLVNHNKAYYEAHNVQFRRLDIIRSKLPDVDLIFCRDCLVHLPFNDVFRALSNVCLTQSAYFMATTFTDRPHNTDILTGQWRPLNLECAPFFLPPPIYLINEACTENDGAFSDKTLGLWRVSDIQKCLQAASAR